MADDASYTAFLTRANADPSASGPDSTHSTSQSRSAYDPSTADSAVPASIRSIRATYTSETDSDFEPIMFNYAGDTLPNVEEFRKVLGPKGEKGVEEVSREGFDPRGEYGAVFEGVERAGTGKGSRVFRVEGSGSRVEYYVVTVGERKLVGVVARAVES